MPEWTDLGSAGELSAKSLRAGRKASMSMGTQLVEG